MEVRTLGHDLAKAVGTCGHVESLRRTAVGEFLEDECLSLEAAQDPEQIAPRLRRVAVPLPP
ncbi:tRNA pseudouridine synthase B, partial [Symbiodinium microadriaticum]